MRRRRLESATAVITAGRNIGNVHKLRHLASMGVVLTLILAELAVLGLPSAAQAGPVKPTVSSFAVTPTSLGYLGGSVTLSAQVTNAISCLFTSNQPGITGLPATIPCSSGTVTDAEVGVPANSGKRTIKYRLHLSVTGAKTVHAKAVSLVVSPAAPSQRTTHARQGDSRLWGSRRHLDTRASRGRLSGRRLHRDRHRSKSLCPSNLHRSNHLLRDRAQTMEGRTR